MRKTVLLSLVFCFALIYGVTSQNTHALTRLQVEEALETGGKYLAEVILDEEGKSRCDYNTITSTWEPYEIPWHTGQAINALVETWSILKKPELLSQAVKAGNWWIGLEIRDHPVLRGMVRSIHGADMGNVIVYATCTDGTPGLFNLTRVTGDPVYAGTATRAGIWLHTHMLDPASGLSYDCVDPVTGLVEKSHSNFWKEKENQSLTDVARPNAEGFLFLDMYRFTGNETYRKWFTDQLETLLRTQNDNGLWMDFTPNNKEEGSVHPRFNLWYAEALMKGYELTNDRRYLESALKCARFYHSVQTSDGAIYYRNYTDRRKPGAESVTGSSVSLAAMVWLQLLNAGAGNEFIPAIEKSAEWIFKNRFSADHQDLNLRGAFIDTRQSSKKGKLWLVNRDLGTIFGLRFLCEYHKYLSY